MADTPMPPISGPQPKEETTTSHQGLPQIEGYQIINLIDEGGMGIVWRAVQLSTNRQVALKLLGSATFGSKKAQLRFEREVELTARLEHPYIARVYDSGLHQGVYYYAMELIDGVHLDQYVNNSQLTHRQIIELFDKICKAVEYAHSKGIIHRDLKPSNVIITDDGLPHIVDFGLAKALLDRDWDPNISTYSEATGTPAYMSPEQAAGTIDAIDTRSDIFSLAVVLYNLLTKCWPHDVSGTRDKVLHNIQTDEPVKPSKLIRHFDSDLETILLKALEKEPKRRYQSVAELRHDLQCWLSGLPIVAKSGSSIYLLRKIISHHRYTSAVAGLLFIIVLGFGYASFDLYLQTKKALQKQAKADRASVEIIQNNKELAAAASNGIRQQAFGWFLLAWHQLRVDEAKDIRNSFPEDSQEFAAVSFLLDEKPLISKEDEFRQTVGKEKGDFANFVVGEYHLKQGNTADALNAYQQCNLDKVDSWLSARIKARLEALKAASGKAIGSFQAQSEKEKQD